MLILNRRKKQRWKLTYAGKINEALSYLDIDEKERLEKYGKFVLNVQKKYAFLTPDYVLLNPRSQLVSQNAALPTARKM